MIFSIDKHRDKYAIIYLHLEKVFTLLYSTSMRGSKYLKRFGMVEYQKHINDRISVSYVRDQMLCQIQCPEEQNEMLRTWSEDSKGNYAGIREFAIKMASQWFRTNFCEDGFCGSGYDMAKLRTSFGEWTFFFELEFEEYEAALLYAYWLFFSGMALVYADETVNFAKRMKEKFSEEKTSTTIIFFKFLKSYAQAKGIPIGTKNEEGNYYGKIDELNNCINESKEDIQNIVLSSVEDKRDMIADCIKTHLTKGRIIQITSLAFPKLADADVQLQKKALLSILHAGIARFYLIQGDEKKCKEEINRALDSYPNNTLALIQHEKLLMTKPENSNTDERKKYVQACTKFKKIIKLIEKKDEYKEKNIKQDKGQYQGQFVELPLIQVRIKFDANMELAHLYSRMGDYNNAEECYKKLEMELSNKKAKLTDNAYTQLESILLLNRGRNCLDSDYYDYAIKYFKRLLDKGDGISSEIRSIAHMNLGLTYSALGDEFENAKAEIIKAIKLDPTNSHSYYNLGVLYYMEEGSVEKAKKFIKKSLYTNIENVDIAESKEYNKFKDSLDRLTEGKNPNLGTGWLQWWFGSRKDKDRKKRRNITNKLTYFISNYGRKIIGVLLLAIISALVIKLNYDLYLHDYLNMMLNRPYTIHSHSLSSTDFILLGVNIVILLLPVISRLKIADVEIDIPVESKGNQIYQLMPIPNSVMRRDVNLNFDFGLFIIDLWY